MYRKRMWNHVCVYVYIYTHINIPHTYSIGLPPAWLGFRFVFLKAWKKGRPRFHIFLHCPHTSLNSKPWTTTSGCILSRGTRQPCLNCESRVLRLCVYIYLETTHTLSLSLYISVYTHIFTYTYFRDYDYEEMVLAIIRHSRPVLEFVWPRWRNSRART